MRSSSVTPVVEHIGTESTDREIDEQHLAHARPSLSCVPALKALLPLLRNELEASPLVARIDDFENLLNEVGGPPWSAQVRKSSTLTGQRKVVTRKGIEEPPIELSLLRQAELGAMLNSGKESAEAAATGAGFLGGDRTAMQLGFFVFGVCLFGYLILHSVGRLIKEVEDGEAWHIIASTIVLNVLATGTMGAAFIARAIFLHIHAHRMAYSVRSLVVLLTACCNMLGTHHQLASRASDPVCVRECASGQCRQ